VGERPRSLLLVSDDSDALVVPVDPTGSEYLSFDPTRSGWAVFLAPQQGFSGDGPRRLFVRFGPARNAEERPKLVVRETHIAFADGVGGRALRDLPLARIEAAVNQPAYYETVLRRLPAASAVMVTPPWGEGASWLHVGPPAPSAPGLKLALPEGRPKPDDFYQQVADVFAYLTTVSPRPANELADANGVRVTTVHGWVKEARRRGLLASGERARRPAADLVHDDAGRGSI
jgi:hypothetical protein